MGFLNTLFGTYSQRELKKIDPIVEQVLSLEKEMEGKTDSQLREMTDIFRRRIGDGETLDELLPEAFAVCREASYRVLNMKHFPVQIIGGIVLHQGRIAEMKTGEGKTLVATLAAYLNALSGNGVHIVTVNDYLAKRDSEWMGKIYEFLGLTVGIVIPGMESEEKRAAYNCDIIYATNNELGFDYLRDNMVVYKDNRVQRKLNFAIVDEVDSILIDEARTPLIISGAGERATQLYAAADSFVSRLKAVRINSDDDKMEIEDLADGDYDYAIDEKAKQVTITANGMAKAEKFFNLENYADPENSTIQHHIQQAMKAHGIMKKDVDYIVKDGEVIIVDEFTGRMMIGRRFNEGLHQAIEAKEKVKVARESKTLATITFQNYFRMYGKLSGMTGTALTEEAEFQEIYKLDVVEVPTNKPLDREDLPDIIYKTEKAKYNAVIDEVAAAHEKGQPVLVGTVSIDKSEVLSGMLKRRGITHQVLNAKFHEKEAEIIAQAGKFGSVTIATNMAGRGTDIKLGGNDDFMARDTMRKEGYTPEMITEATGYGDTDNDEILTARGRYAELAEEYRKSIEPEAEKVKNAGGLFIVGTERHESRRIDNQLRGRSGRQGDPGMSRFYLSLEDDLMRLFGGEAVTNVMNIMKIDEDMPIESKMITGTVEKAQKKIEGQHFAMRKTVLQYDDVMNQQREIIYGQRTKVLEGEDISENIHQMIVGSIKDNVMLHLADEEVHDEWNLSGLRAHYLGVLTQKDDFKYSVQELADISRDDIENMLIDRANKIYENREKEMSSEIMRELERVVLLRCVDTQWMEHIDNMDRLRSDMGLRAKYAQKDPFVMYRIEGSDMFDEMINSIREDAARMILTVRISGGEQEPKREQVAKESATSGDGTVKKEPVRKAKIGRNDPCPCGSGLKYKKCCGKNL